MAAQLTIGGGKIWWGAFAFLLILLLVPIALTELPPLLDYPNHLARLYVLAFGADDPFLSKMYATHWALIPNIALDLIGPPLLHVLPLYTAGRVLVASAVLLPVIGCVAYARAAFGHFTWWSLASGLVAYHALVLQGFINFDIAVGLALIFAAAWIAWRDLHPVACVAAAILFAVLLFFFHLFGLAFYLLLIGSRELVIMVERWPGTGDGDQARLVARRCGAVALVTALPLSFLILSPVPGAQFSPVWASPLTKFIDLTVPFLNYHEYWDLAPAVLVLGFLCVGAATRTVRFFAPALVAAAILVPLFIALPRAMMETGFIEPRLPVMLGFLLFAACAPVALPRRAAVGAGLLFSTLILLRVGLLTQDWLQSRVDTQNVRMVIADVPEGSKVLAVTLEENENPAYWHGMPRSRLISRYCESYFHLPALLVPERHAFWPLLFSASFKQPLQVLPPYDELAIPEGRPPDYQVLAQNKPSSSQLDEDPYLEDWQEDFDYVLLLLAGGVPDAPHYLPGKLEYITGNDTAALYRIRKSQP